MLEVTIWQTTSRINDSGVESRRFTRLIFAGVDEDEQPTLCVAISARRLGGLEYVGDKVSLDFFRGFEK